MRGKTPRECELRGVGQAEYCGRLDGESVAPPGCPVKEKGRQMSIDDDVVSDDVLDMLAALDEAQAPARAELARLEAQMARGVFLTSAEGFIEWTREYLRIEAKQRREIWHLDDLDTLRATHRPPTEDYGAHLLRLAWVDRDVLTGTEERWGGLVLYILEVGNNKVLVKGALYDNDESVFYYYRDLMAKAAEELPHEGEVKLPELESLVPNEIDGETHIHGVRRETVRRANLFRQIKDSHPEYPYKEVAREATRSAKVRASPGETSITYTANDVRNAYRAMKWSWKRARKIR